MNVVLIDKEFIAAQNIKFLLENIVGRKIAVVCILNSVKKAIEWFKSNPCPDLILSEVDLIDGLSFDIFKKVNINCPIIYYNLDDQYAFQAFDHNGFDYLLKPISEENLIKSFSKLDRHRAYFISQSDLSEKLNKVVLELYRSYEKALMVYVRDRIIPVPTSEIDFIYKDLHCVYIYSKSQKYVINENLDQIILKLDPKLFRRANRQFILHRDSVSHIIQSSGRKIIVRLIGYDIEVIVSKKNAVQFTRWLELIND